MLKTRDELLLKKLIELYLKDGKPVGSRTLSKLPEVGVSPATVRNVMADLEGLGLIRSPHTSAGRIPTSKGLRLYVDRFLTCQPLSVDLTHQLVSEIGESGDAQSVMDTASRLLSELTGMVSVVLMPDRRQERLSHVEFIRLADRRVLVVLVFNGQEAENRFIELDADIDADQLQRMANFFNTELVGLTLHAARDQLLQKMSVLREQLNGGMLRLVQGAEDALEAHEQGASPVKVQGEKNLLQYEELADIQQLKQLFNSFEEHQAILSLLDKSIAAKGLQVFIGRETGLELYDPCAVITHPFDMGDELVGVLGVLGPRRMPYERIIPMVDVTAKIVDSVLKKHVPIPIE